MKLSICTLFAPANAGRPDRFLTVGVKPDMSQPITVIASTQAGKPGALASAEQAARDVMRQRKEKAL